MLHAHVLRMHQAPQKNTTSFRVPTLRALGIGRRDRHNPSAPTAANNTEYTLHTTAERVKVYRHPFLHRDFFSAIFK